MGRKASPKSRFLFFFLALTGALVTAGLAHAESGVGPEPVYIGESRVLHSKVLDEDRTLLIYLPLGYEMTDKKYPVIYFLDGAGHYLHGSGLLQYLAASGRISELIAVAVVNTDRTRDFTPEPSAAQLSIVPTAGGADSFLDFFTDELIPYIDGTYRTQPFRILMGHSLGGLFAVYTMLNRPEVFEAYISISPSLHWNNRKQIVDAERIFKGTRSFKKFFYMTMGDEPGDMVGDAESFAKILRKHAPKDFHWHYEYLKNENHNTTPHLSLYGGLEFIYSDWAIKDWMEYAKDGGLESFDLHYQDLSKKYGYPIRTPETTVNTFGYWLIGQERLDEAISVLKRNVEEYPGSANVYDSLGDAFDAKGDLDKALENYKIAVEKAKSSSHPYLPFFRQNLNRMLHKIVTVEGEKPEASSQQE